MTRRLANVGGGMDDVGLACGDHGVVGFHASYQVMPAALKAKTRDLNRR